MVDATHLPNCHLPNLAKRRYSRLRLKIHQIHTFPKIDNFHRAKHQICAFCFLRNAAFCFLFCRALSSKKRDPNRTVTFKRAKSISAQSNFLSKSRPPPFKSGCPAKKNIKQGFRKEKQAICGFFTAEPLFREIHGKSVFFCGTPSWVFFCETPFSTPVSILTFDTRIFVGIDYDVRFAVD